MSATSQPDLPLLDSDAGYTKWQDERARYRQALEQKLGLPIGAKVRITLRDFDRPFTGILELAIGTENNPRLRLRGFQFDFTLEEIISIHRL